MIHEYTLDPETAFAKNGFWTLLKDFGVAHGRVLVECPGDTWAKDMEQALCRARNELGWNAYQKLTERWAQLRQRKALVRRRTALPHKRTISWLEHTCAEHSIDPFQGILTEQSRPKIPELLSKEAIELGNELWLIETQRVIDRDSLQIAACAGPLGRISSHLLIVDPYFTEDKKWRDSLLAILQHSRASDGHFERVEVHTVEFNARERSGGRSSQAASKHSILEEKLPKDLPQRLPKGVAVRFFVWSERDGGERYHRRYILTERGGIFVEGGLDRGSEGQTTDIGLLSDNVFVQRWKEYQPETAAFDLAGEPFVIKSSR